MRSSSRAAYALLFASPLLFAANILTARGVAGTIPPVALAFWRWSLTLVFLVPYAWSDLRFGWRRLAREWRTFLMLGGLSIGVCGAPVYLGAQTTTATNIGLIYAGAPVLIIVFSRLFWGEAATWRQSAGIVLCVLGVGLVVLRGDLDVLLHLRFVFGDLLVLAATIAWALYSVLLKHRPSRETMAVRLVGIVVAGVAVTAPFYAWELAAGIHATFDARTVGIIVFLALVPGIAAYLAYSWLVAHLGPSRTGLTLYLGPLYNAALAYLFLGEQVHAYHLAGAALILPGLWLATFAPRAVAEPGPDR
jgi:drug/metabolite transporter (DMT)-like permease